MGIKSLSSRRSPIASPTVVRFYVLCGNHAVRVSVDPEADLAELFANLQQDAIAYRVIQAAKATYDDCAFYKLVNPVLFVQSKLQEGDAFLLQAKRKCEEMGNTLLLEPLTTTVRLLAERFSPDYAYLVIKLPDLSQSSSSKNAIEMLKRVHPSLFECLRVTANCLGLWTITDVEVNQKGGALTRELAMLPHAFREVHDTLVKRRCYKESDVTGNRDYLVLRQWYKAQFDLVFEPILGTSTPTLVDFREFAAFYNVLRGFNGDVPRIVGYGVSSTLKASNFAVHFIQPPFFSFVIQNFNYEQDTSWGFPIFVEAIDSPNAIRKFIPRNDCIVVSSRFRIPFVICEITSDKRESDRARMLVQAVALARTGQFLMRSTSHKKFFVVAIYVDANVVVSRYIVMQTRDENTQELVSIHRKDFDLRVEAQQIYFLREMYNLAAQIDVLSGELDSSKKRHLRDIHAAASGVMSFSNEHKTDTTDDISMCSMTGESIVTEESQDGDDLGVFGAEDVQDILCRMDYKVEFVLYGHPHLAVIVQKTGDVRKYLKFVQEDGEVEILQYLTGIPSSSNYTISGVQFWTVGGGTVIVMPVAGGWLTSLKNPNERLWSVALQLVEAVAFMHEHHVAHMDLKPQNIIVPPDGGRLSIVDFNASIRVRNADTMYKGVVGTEGYIAPEVTQGKYKPMLADLWSCGRTLEEVCAGCRPSEDCKVVLEICKKLMNPDPEARPKMSDVLQWMLSRHGDSAARSPNDAYTSFPISKDSVGRIGA